MSRLDAIKLLEEILGGEYCANGNSLSSFKFRNGIEIHCDVKSDKVSFIDYEVSIYDDSDYNEAYRGLMEIVSKVMLNYPNKKGLEVAKNFDDSKLELLLKALN